MDTRTVNTRAVKYWSIESFCEINKIAKSSFCCQNLQFHELGSIIFELAKINFKMNTGCQISLVLLFTLH